MDVIIIGAGPAGSSAAYDLAKAGKKVLLLDKEYFPRDKPCGGGLTIKTLKLLKVDVRAVLERDCSLMEITNKIKHKVIAPDLGPFCSMVQRPMFDTLLRDAAVDAGAIFKKIEDISIIKQSSNRVEISLTNGENISASYVIAADGAKSAVRRLVHPKKVVTQAFALEGKAPLADVKTVSFDFFVVPFGYGWVFPKGGHLNVGICTFNRKVKISRKELLDYCHAKLGHNNLAEVVGYPLGIGPNNGNLSIGRILFIGDAGGNVEPLLGEGIHNAIYSAQSSATALIKFKSPLFVNLFYWFRMQRQWMDIYTSSNLARVFYRFPKLGWFFLSQQWFLRRLIHGFTTGKRLDTSVRGG
jgi:geranylgeranyl reductase family protein